MKSMKLFLTVFAAILAAGAVILTGIYAKARLDDWEKAKWMIIARMNNENAATKAIYDRYMAEAHQQALLAKDYSDVATVNQLTEAAVEESRQSLSRLHKIRLEAIALLEHKPFGLPLTADEQQGLNDLKRDVANPTPTPAAQAAPAAPAVPPDESMKPTTEVSETEHQRRREAQQREAEETYPRAKAVSPREMAAPPAPTPY
jgi:hypothetical protein